jgi:hypothetical protein
MLQNQTVNAKRIGHEGQQVYEHLRQRLEKRYKGKIVAIEVESGDYFVGDTLQEAIQKARTKYPNKIFYSVRVGYPAVYSFSSGAPISSTATTSFL